MHNKQTAIRFSKSHYLCWLLWKGRGSDLAIFAAENAGSVFRAMLALSSLCNHNVDSEQNRNMLPPTNRQKKVQVRHQNINILI